MSRAAATLLAATMLAACGRSGQDAAPLAGSSEALREEPCWFDNIGANPATCAWLRPTRQDSTGGTELPVVVLRERAQQPSDHVVIFLNGGPGGESGFNDEGMRLWRMRRANLGLWQDFVVYDQRGSGLSRPELACPEQDEALRDERAHQRSSSERMDAFFAVIEDCAQRVPLADRRTGLYSTQTAVADLNDLIRALKARFGYQRVSLYGASYGTRLAIMAMQQPEFPVQAMVLDSLHPPGFTSFMPYPEDFEAQLDIVDDYCGEGHCQLPRGGIRPLLRAAMDRLQQAPMLSDVRDPQRPGQRLPVRLDSGDLPGMVLFALYIEPWARQLPDMLGKLADGEPDERWQSLFELVTFFGFEMGINFTSNTLIRCRDEPPIDKKKLASQLDQWTMFHDVAPPMARFWGMCDRLAIPNAALPSDWRVDVPTLVLNIQGDLHTPADHAIQAMERFGNAELIVLPGSGHGVIDFDLETAGKAGRFLNGDLALDELLDDDDLPDVQMCLPPEETPYTA